MEKNIGVTETIQAASKMNIHKTNSDKMKTVER